MAIWRQAGGRDLVEAVNGRRADLAQRRDRSLPFLPAPDESGGDREPPLPAQGLRNVRDRRQVQHADHASGLLRRARRPVAIGPDPARSQLGWEEQSTGVSLRDRQQLHVQRRDHRVPAATTAQRPEEVGVGRGIDGASLTLRGDQLDRPHPVARPSVLAAEPAEPAAERVAGHAHVGRGPGQERATRLCRRLRNIGGPRPGLDASAAILDLDAAHALGLDQDHVVERSERHGAVSGSLRRHPQPVVAREADHLRDVIRALHEGDRGGPLIGGQVPSLTRLVPVRVVAGRYPPADREFG